MLRCFMDNWENYTFATVLLYELKLRSSPETEVVLTMYSAEI